MRQPWQGTRITKNGRVYWRVSVTVRDEYGRKSTKGFERKLLIDAQNAARAWLSKSGRTIETPIGTLSELFGMVEPAVWSQTGDKNRRDMAVYRSKWEKALGDLPVTSIDAPALTRSLASLAHGKSSSYIAKASRCISQALAYAVSDLGWLESNPALGMRRPKPNRDQKRYPPMDRAEYERMLALAPKRERLMVRLVGECGMRPSEAGRVKPSDLFSVNDRWLVRIPLSKTAAGVRPVPVSDSLMREIESAEPWGIEDPAMHISKWWRERSETRLYDLRGWCADEWRRRGVPDQVRSWLLGHSRVGFTQRVYETLTAADTLEMFA